MHSAILAALLILMSSSGADVKPEQPDCESFPEKLRACETHQCHYKHVLTRQLYLRDLRRSKRHCVFTEQWPEGSKLICRLGRKQMRELAHYYSVYDTGTDIAYQPLKDPKTGAPRTELKVNGSILQNLPEEYVEKGICRITSVE